MGRRRQPSKSGGIDMSIVDKVKEMLGQDDAPNDDRPGA
jgi:hypothetical protein